MPQDFSSIIGMVSDILSDPEKRQAFTPIIESIMPSSAQPEPDTQSTIKGIASSLSNTPDKRSMLLNAMRPYLGDTKGVKLDRAVKYMKLLKVRDVIKQMDLF